MVKKKRTYKVYKLKVDQNTVKSATYDTVSQWFDRGIARGAHHMIIIWNRFGDRGNYPIYIDNEDVTVREYVKENNIDLRYIVEVYNLLMDRDTQLDKVRNMCWE